jgi:hypothetical protein
MILTRMSVTPTKQRTVTEMTVMITVVIIIIIIIITIKAC